MHSLNETEKYLLQQKILKITESRQVPKFQVDFQNNKTKRVLTTQASSFAVLGDKNLER